MERDFKKELENFCPVWARVERGRGELPKNIKLMPEREPGSAAVRFRPPGMKP
ncbi:MAG: hypothetical protein ACOX68_04135 [Candidatus Limivicinus sp.]|jgi:hypothetical protein